MEEKILHSHKPNFGRYVAECPACVAKWPDGPPVRERREKTVAASATDELVQIMLRKEAKAAQKEEDDSRRRQIAREHDVQVAMEEIANKKMRQDNCPHVKENGKSAVMGQIHSDGMYHPLCIRCFKEFEPRQPTSDQLSMGVA